MTWLALPHLTDGQYYLVCVAVAIMVVTGPLLARSWWRRARIRACVRSSRRHPSNRPPYDWAADTRYRQAVSVHRRAS